MSSSFTTWYKRRDRTNADPSLALHINLWIHSGKKNDSIDFGLMIKKPRSIDELYIYVPFVCSDSDILNLVKILVDDKSSSELVFNEDMTYRERRGEIQKVTLRESGRFEYYSLDCTVIDELDGNKLADGRIIKYIFDPSLSGDDIYIRFRINNIAGKGLVERYQKSASYLTGAYNTLTSFEINFHEFRKLPANIYQKAEHNHLKISLVNLFVMTDIHMEYIFSNIDKVKSRILEKEGWVKYNQKLAHTSNDKILAYQFKKQATRAGGESVPTYLDGFSIFSKFNDEGAKWRSVFFAILFAFLLGMSGSWTASYIEKNDFNITETAIKIYNERFQSVESDGNGDSK